MYNMNNNHLPYPVGFVQGFKVSGLWKLVGLDLRQCRIPETIFIVI
jgi:hypothetical protein